MVKRVDTVTGEHCRGERGLSRTTGPGMPTYSTTAPYKISFDWGALEKLSESDIFTRVYTYQSILFSSRRILM
jgi:hypothetical protein